MNILNLLPKLYLPNRLFFGTKASMFFKSIEKEKKFFITSQSYFAENKEKITKLIGESEHHLHSGEPHESHINDVSEKVTDTDAAYVVAIGGGSVIDLAKIAVKNSDKQLIAIPTTIGSGAEVSQHAVYLRDGEKTVESDYSLLPDVALIDPTYLSTLSNEQVAYQLIDSCAHALESLVSRASHPVSDMFATKALDIIFNEELLQDRAQLQLAGLYAGIAQSSAATGLVHSFAHNIGPEFNISHAKAVSLFLPDVVEFNISKNSKPYEKLSATEFLTTDTVVNKLEKLYDILGIKPDMPTIEPDKIESLAERIKKDITAITNPVPATIEEITTILTNYGSS